MNTFRRFRLRIPAEMLAAMTQQSLAERPNECCGILAGVIDGEIAMATDCYPLKNALQSPIRFESETKELFHAYRDMRQKGTELLAAYHSHPESEPIPSRTDLQMSCGEQTMCLIIGLQGAKPRLRAWWLAETGFTEGEWEAVAEAGPV